MRYEPQTDEHRINKIAHKKTTRKKRKKKLVTNDLY